MSMSDPISDMLTRIRNAQMTKKSTVSMPYSKIKLAIANVLKEEGYIESSYVDEKIQKRNLTIKLRYYCDDPVIKEIKRISKPGLRIYKSRNDLPEVMNGLGIAIVSTSKGVVSSNKAKAMQVGGELLCTVV